MTNFGQGMMIVLSSPSGAGKTTLTRMLSEKNDNFIISISHTTRTPRHNETNGKDYFFVSKDKFQSKSKNLDTKFWIQKMILKRYLKKN